MNRPANPSELGVPCRRAGIGSNHSFSAPGLRAHARRGGRAVECGGLENRYPSLGGSRVQIPPPPLDQAVSAQRSGLESAGQGWPFSPKTALDRLTGALTGPRLAHTSGRQSGAFSLVRLL